MFSEVHPDEGVSRRGSGSGRINSSSKMIASRSFGLDNGNNRGGVLVIG